MKWISKLTNNIKYFKNLLDCKGFILGICYYIVLCSLFLHFKSNEIDGLHNTYFLTFIFPYFILYFINKNYQIIFNEMCLIRMQDDKTAIFIFKKYNFYIIFIMLVLDILVYALMVVSLFSFRFIIYLLITMLFFEQYYLLLSNILNILLKYLKSISKATIVVGLLIAVIQALQLDLSIELSYLSFDLIKYVSYIFIFYIINQIIELISQYEGYLLKILKKVNYKNIGYILLWIFIILSLGRLNQDILYYQLTNGTLYGFVVSQEDSLSMITTLIRWYIPLEMIILVMALSFINHYQYYSIYFMIRTQNQKKWFLKECKQILSSLFLMVMIFVGINYFVYYLKMDFYHLLVNLLYLFVYLILFIELHIYFYLLMKKKYSINLCVIIYFLLLYFIGQKSYNNCLFLNHISLLSVFMCLILVIGMMFIILYKINHDYME